MQDILDNRNPLNPDENEVSSKEVKQALEAYLRHDVERRDPNYTYDAFEDTRGMVDAVYNAAVEALHKLHYVVVETSLAEDAMFGDDELTIEDVLIPRRDQGADLRGDVTKADVVDPNNPDEHERPNPQYISRMMTLAGQRPEY
jgi:hypothetical protein